MNRFFYLLLIAVFLTSCTEGSVSDLIPLPLEKDRIKSKVDVKLSARAKVDILFIIDDSPSMGAHQLRLAHNSQLFVDAITQNQVLDTHYGVITSNMDPNFCGGRMGHLVGTPSYVSKSKDPTDFRMKLVSNLQPGQYCSGTERFFDSIMASLNPALIAGQNAGFFRKDAHLALIFITDTHDQSALSGEALYDFLLQLKGGDARKILVYGALAPVGVSSCPRDGFKFSEQITSLIEKTKGIHFSLCDPLYGKKLASVGADISSRIDLQIPLKTLPADGTIKVMVGAYELPNDSEKGWIFDAYRNEIFISSGVKIPESYIEEELSVSYTPADMTGL